MTFESAQAPASADSQLAFIVDAWPKLKSHDRIFIAGIIWPRCQVTDAEALAAIQSGWAGSPPAMQGFVYRLVKVTLDGPAKRGNRRNAAGALVRRKGAGRAPTPQRRPTRETGGD